MHKSPHTYSAADRYCRMLPAFDYGMSDHAMARRMTALAKGMLTAKLVGAGTPIQAGYTYFGQFIFHDLTGDSTPIRRAGSLRPEKTINYRTPLLDLESVYGDGPQSKEHGHLYAADGSFVLGAAITQKGAAYDVPIKFGRKSVVDSRNIENAITRQMHVLFLRLHNKALGEAPAATLATRFSEARKRVRRQFQWLVRWNFCSLVCDPGVFLGDGSWLGDRFRWPRGKFSIPVEFAQAAARFGHSMVREDYRLRPPAVGRKFNLIELFDPKLREANLPESMALDWHHLFSSAPAMLIDRHIVDPLAQLKDENFGLYGQSSAPHAPFSLPERTLKRGLANRLPTGQAICAALRLPRPTISVAQTQPEQMLAWHDLQKWGLEERTPLWYYILLEAELTHGGARLGPLGSRLLLDVIDAALAEDKESIAHDPHNDPLHPFQWGGVRVKNPADLARVVGL